MANAGEAVAVAKDDDDDAFFFPSSTSFGRQRPKHVRCAACHVYLML